MKGFRRIVVDNVTFRWRFDEKLVVIPVDRSGPQLYVEWGWADWLEPGVNGQEPQIITPQFVADAIRFAMGVGWPQHQVRTSYANGRFELSFSKSRSE